MTINLDNIKGVSPEEKINRLRELREKKLKELEEMEKTFKKDMKDTEELLRKSIQELEEQEEKEEEGIKERRERIRRELQSIEEEEQSLENIVGPAQTNASEEEFKHYRLGSTDIHKVKEESTYTPLRQAIDSVYTLAEKDRNQMGETDWHQYESLKAKLSNMEKYQTSMSQQTADELNAFKKAFKDWQYRLG